MSEKIQKQISSLLGVEYKDLPAVRIFENKMGQKYKFPSDVTKMTRKNLQTFLDDFEDLQLDPYFRSAPIPNNEGKLIQQVVGDTQMKIIHNFEKDVLALYTAPWCKECKDS